MFNHYNAGDTNVKINACSGGIYRTYKESWFVYFKLDGPLANKILKKDGCYYRAYKGYSCNKYDLVDTYNEGIDEIKEIIVLQMILSGDNSVIAELICKDDFNRYFDTPNY